EVGGIIYRIYDTYAVLLKCYSGDRVIELPAMIRTSAGAEVPLTIVADTAFDTCDHLQYLKVPEGVTTILFRTFLNCRNLREVVLPDTLFSIQGNTFENTPGVTVISHAGTYAHQAAMNLGIPWREGSELSAVIE
ncbi:MAG: leucine-rich repeat protein, partial [Lachnospiraceae bacterium]|nr:leucine-rich repeat protein [Lachnospiraceae bacterium]